VLVTIREERPEDIAAIRAVNRAAFGQPDEGVLIDALRENSGVLLSLVAVVDGRVVGHILYSPVSVDADGGKVMGAGLGPMAVLPAHQRQGIGAKLLETGNEKLRQAGYPFIVVLGHAAYYPRFGFRPAREHGLRCEWDVPDDIFMALVLDPPRMQYVSGLVRYRPEFTRAG
jgi:putative acetyltransferase